MNVFGFSDLTVRCTQLNDRSNELDTLLSDEKMARELVCIENQKLNTDLREYCEKIELQKRELERLDNLLDDMYKQQANSSGVYQSVMVH